MAWSWKVGLDIAVLIKRSTVRHLVLSRRVGATRRAAKTPPSEDEERENLGLSARSGSIPRPAHTRATRSGRAYACMRPNEAYATIVAQDGWHACSAAVLGRILQRLDPTRRRAVLVHKVSTATRAMLRRDDLWEVVTMEHPFRLPQSTLPWFSTLRALQAQLWSLPYERVLYFDTDHLPLPVQVHRLTGLWKAAENTALAAPSEGDLSVGCFNSGMMLLRPGKDTMSKLQEAAAHLEKPHARKELLALRRRCPNGWNLDQPLINYVFPRGAWQQLHTGTRGHETLWRMSTTFHPLHGSGPALCEARSSGELAGLADSFHYMAPFRPWQRARDHSRCILHGVDCLTHDDVERFSHATHFANGSAVFGPWLNCSLWGAAASVWWSEYVQLDGRTRQVCERRM